MKKLTRRGLFGLARDATPPAEGRPGGGRSGGFSLDSFYRDRAARGDTTGATLPRFRVRTDLFADAPATSPVGVPQREAMPADVEAFEPPPPAADARYAARVRSGACLAHLGSFCTTCRERCPEEGAIVLEEGRPRIVEDHCTGCGQCVPLCPAPARSAIELYERASTVEGS